VAFCVASMSCNRTGGIVGFNGWCSSTGAEKNQANFIVVVLLCSCESEEGWEQLGGGEGSIVVARVGSERLGTEEGWSKDGQKEGLDSKE
jgi:hypothetical protein